VARYLVTAPVTVPFASYTSPGGYWWKGACLELTPAQVTEIGAANLRAIDNAHMHDALGEETGVSNGD
jgi:hypothetical protein